MEKLLAFHGKQEIKDKIIKHMQAHIDADELVRGETYNEVTGKGCFIGCALNDYNHKAFETKLGIPEWLARVFDTLHEGISEKYALNKIKPFAMVLKDIPLGCDLNTIKIKFTVFILEQNLTYFDHEKFPNVVKCNKDIIALYKSGEPNVEGSEKWESAESAAWSAAESAAKSAACGAESAAWSAACGAAWSAAESAAKSAESAAWFAATWSAWSAWSAAKSAATWSAWSAAKSAAYDKYADFLIELIKECK